MVSGAYIADQAFFSVAYFITAILFLLQLLVERKAKYDAKVLNARQRLDDWHADRGNHRGSNLVSPRGSSSMPKTARRASAAPVSQDDDSTSVSRLEGSKGSVTETMTGSHEKKHRRLRVGLLQWSFHRLGFIMALIMCWREVDPYGVHGIFSFVHVQFLSLNAQAILYICAIIAFFYPIHLVRVVAFHTRTRPLEILGITLSIITLALSNITPGLYSKYGVVNGLRAITSIWFGITLLLVCVVFNVYMFRLVKAIHKLTDEDGWKGETATEMTGQDKKQGSQYQAEHSTSKRAASPLVPILDFNTNGSAAGLTVAASATASRNSSRRNSFTGNNNGGSQINLLRSASPTADMMTTDEEYGSSSLITPARLPSSNEEASDPSDQSNKPSPRGQPNVFPSLSNPITPSHSTRNLASPSNQQQQASVVVEVNNEGGTSSTPASPTLAAQPSNGTGSALNSARVPSAKADIIVNTNTNNKKKNLSPYARQYHSMLRKMQKFQILATIIVVIVCAAITVSGMQQAAKFNEEFDVPKGDDYMGAILIALFVLIVLVGEWIIFWYAYMPISILWTDILRKPKSSADKAPAASPSAAGALPANPSANNSASAISVV